MSTMTFAKIAAAALVSGALGMAGLGVGAGIASADPGHGMAMKRRLELGHNDGGNWRGPNYRPGYYGHRPDASAHRDRSVSGSLCV